MKHLIEKRAALLAEYDTMKKTLETEKRSAFTSEEFEKVNKIKFDIEEIEKQIATEKDFEAKRNLKIDNVANNINVADNKDIVMEFRSFLNGDSKESKFIVPFNSIEQRATITTSSNAAFSYTDQVPSLSINDSELVLGALGVKTWYFDSGSQLFPSISQITGSFGSEDNSVSDQTLTSASVTLAPTFVSASLEVSKKFLANSKPENIASLIAELKLAVDKAVEKRTIDSMNSLTSAVATGTSVTFHSGTTIMEAAIVGAPSGYIFSTSGIARAKNRRIDAGSGRLVYSDGMVNGYPAKRSSLQTQANYAYLVDAKAVAMAYWGEGISIEVITDATLGRKGNVLLIASAMADGSYLDANKVSVVKNISNWT